MGFEDNFSWGIFLHFKEFSNSQVGGFAVDIFPLPFFLNPSHLMNYSRNEGGLPRELPHKYVSGPWSSSVGLRKRVD